MEEKFTLYVETTIPSYLVSRPSRDLVVAGHQSTTREFWQSFRNNFQLVISQLVLQECQSGDPTYAKLRIDLLDEIPILEETVETYQLALKLRVELGLPERAKADATHLALAAFHRVDFLLTWNCKHLANPKLTKRIDKICRASGCIPPNICTPEQFVQG